MVTIYPQLQEYVVVNFLSQVIFLFLLFLGMVLKKEKNYLR